MAYSRSHAHRGKKLENLVNRTNNMYRNAGIADVRKVPTPTNIKKVEGKNVSAELGRAEWVDYSGVWQGRSVVFDTKETTQERLPLQNIKEHQYKTLVSWGEHGALAFLLVAFWLKGKNEPEIYILNFLRLKELWEDAKKGGAKSINLEYFKKWCPRVGSENGYAVNYLPMLYEY